MNTEYANMAPAALAGSRYVRLWIDEAVRHTGRLSLPLVNKDL